MWHNGFYKWLVKGTWNSLQCACFVQHEWGKKKHALKKFEQHKKGLVVYSVKISFIDIIQSRLVVWRLGYAFLSWDSQGSKVLLLVLCVHNIDMWDCSAPRGKASGDLYLSLCCNKCHFSFSTGTLNPLFCLLSWVWFVALPGVWSNLWLQDLLYTLVATTL